MKVAFSICLLLASLTCCAQMVSQHWIKLVNNKYSLQSPANWSVDSSKQLGTALVLFAPLENTNDRFRENVNLLMQQIPAALDLTKYTALSEQQIKTMAPDAAIIESKRMLTGGRSYQKIMYMATQNGLKLYFEQYYYVQTGRAYVITLTTEQSTFEAYRLVGEQVLNSFVPMQ